ncbi:MAG TPA: hypothetical protein VHI54_06450 [Actinomycetota bacterium]|nr:hypothetical protein [Actinomycetota bacterium]
MTIRHRAADAAYRGLTLAARSPALAISLARIGRYGHPLSRETEIVIEGFPRSGTSFAVAAFRRAQHRPVRIAHHLHAPGHVIAASRTGVPTLIVIRHPDEAVLDFAQSKPNLSVGAILQGYVRFHEPLLPHRWGFVTARFGDVLSDFNSVIRLVNDRFGTAFEEFDATQNNLAAVHADVERDYEERKGSAPRILQAKDDRPVGAPEDGAEAEYHRNELVVLRTRARTVYEELAGGA